jgi:hypothetical protein
MGTGGGNVRSSNSDYYYNSEFLLPGTGFLGDRLRVVAVQCYGILGSPNSALFAVPSLWIVGFTCQFAVELIRNRSAST